MGLKASFAAAENKSRGDLQEIISKSQLYKKTQMITRLKNERQKATLSSIILIFTKTSLIDRNFSQSELLEITKRIRRFLDLEDENIQELIFEAKKELSGSIGRSPDFVAAPFAYLGKIANDKTKERLFRYLTEIVAADKKTENEEMYLLEIAGAAFGLSEKSVREYLLATELKSDLEEVQIKDEWKDSFSSQAGAEPPVIKFEISE